MNINWQTIITALGLAFVMEGLLYCLFAERMSGVLRALSEQPPSLLRLTGLAGMIVGVIIVALSR